MNKQQFIEQELDKNKLRYGRWHSTERKDSASKIKLLTQNPPTDEDEALQHGNALANTGNYPLGTDGCFNVGISGGCGPECYVYKNGDCDSPEEIGDEETCEDTAR